MAFQKPLSFLGTFGSLNSASAFFGKGWWLGFPVPTKGGLDAQCKDSLSKGGMTIGYIAIKKVMVGWNIVGDEIFSQICGDYSINHYENMYQTTRIQWNFLLLKSLPKRHMFNPSNM